MAKSDIFVSNQLLLAYMVTSIPRAAEAIVETLFEPRLDAITAALAGQPNAARSAPGAITGLLAQTGPALLRMSPSWA